MINLKKDSRFGILYFSLHIQDLHQGLLQNLHSLIHPNTAVTIPPYSGSAAFSAFSIPPCFMHST